LNNNKLLELNDKGLFCSKGGFYIDPLRAVEKALITHAHSDHARLGSKSYLAVDKNINILKLRFGKEVNLQTVKYNEVLNINGIKVSFHPAGHILGSAQIKLESDKEIVVVSGDYKNEEDITCEKFEPVCCTTFITESTFGLPIYKWSPQIEIFDEINNWWKLNAENGITSVLFGYSLGKAQRLISGLDPSIGPVLTHRTVERMNDCYRSAGINLPLTADFESINDKSILKESLIIAPPASDNLIREKKIDRLSVAFASGWMQVRSMRRRRNIDKGFVLSDHCDWDGLINTIKETGAEKIFVTHGYTSVLVRWLKENGWDASPLESQK
jgi:putative mRNA 3-end processing factor